MKEWKESGEEIREITPDKEMAISLSKMMEVRIDALTYLDSKKHTSVIVDGYYEIIKEAITALMAIYGYKTTSHEVLVGYLKEFYKEFSAEEINFIDSLRKLRNKIDYKGFFVKEEYLNRNLPEIIDIINKLKGILNEKIG